MKIKSYLFLTFSLLGLGVVSCQKKQQSNKILDGAPVIPNVTVIPALAGQQFILLHSAILNIVIPVLNKTALASQTYPELTGPDGSSRYSFQLNSPRYGSATLTLQFKDFSNGTIDPIQTQNSTSTLSSVLITNTGSSSLFNYTENLTMTLQTAGLVSSPKTMTGAITFTGSNNVLTFTFSGPGSSVVFEGVTDGTIVANGTGLNAQPVSMSFTYIADHSSNGSISWEGQSGTLHYNFDGIGFIISDQSRLIIN